MIIKITGADYSSCGLGKAPYASSDVLELLTGYEDVSVAMQNAFQDFFDSIGGVDGDIWGKVKYMIAPCFSTAKTMPEAFWDLKSKSIRYHGKSDYQNESSANTNFKYDGDGIIPSVPVSNALHLLYASGTDTAESAITSQFCPFFVTNPRSFITYGGVCTSGQGNISFDSSTSSLKAQFYSLSLGKNNIVQNDFSTGKNIAIAYSGTGGVLKHGYVNGVVESYNNEVVLPIGTSTQIGRSVNVPYSCPWFIFGYAVGLRDEEAAKISVGLESIKNELK